ncbi:MAG TPA: YopX family protein [Sphingomicrobium sp.]|nr:YopX family protein [Sphingomicrobium sp.]
MREIKFRAWDKKSKRMIYDIQDAYDGLKGFEPREDDSAFPTSFGRFLDEDGVVVMQYTGLKDKNGQHIFEGDLIVEKKLNFYVTPTEIKFERYGWNVFGEMDFGHGASGDLRPEDCEVVGNIHENPDLIPT